jgi:hypothetical protein
MEADIVVRWSIPGIRAGGLKKKERKPLPFAELSSLDTR